MEDVVTCSREGEKGQRQYRLDLEEIRCRCDFLKKYCVGR
jgi:hypothetical protein